MASRLSKQSDIMIYHQGFRSFRTTNKPTGILLPAIELDRVLIEDQAVKVIQDLHPQNLYFSLKNKGLEDSLDVLPLVSSEQFVKIMDYDVWQKNELCPKQAFYWLSLYGKISGKQALERLRQLDEEYQIAVFASHVRVYDKVEYDQFIDQEQDQLYALPGNEIYYRILSNDDQVLHSHIKEVIDSLVAHDMNYTILLLAQSSNNPPREAEHLLTQFRRARLEEDGFVLEEESRTYFIPATKKEISTLAKKHLMTTPMGCLVSNNDLQDSFLERVLSSVTKQEKKNELILAVGRLANALCAASDVETDDVSGLKKIMGHAYGTVSFALEYIVGGDVDQGVVAITNEYPKKLFQVGLGLMEDVRQRFLQSLENTRSIDSKQIREDLSLQRFGVVLHSLEKSLLGSIGLEQTEVIKCLYNRYPLYPKYHEDMDQVSRLYFAPITSVVHFYQLVDQLNIVADSMGIDRLEKDKFKI